ncbi:MAG TPA: gluconate 2-dehydrogenase subunit 3 family protein, partial [Candidatus Binatia bacterium]|nr:gluconate 2-dehydrogenase subunit 3 family protein [Candidatus Binatia bacterium]
MESAAWLDPEARAVAEVLLVLVLPAAAGAPSAREAGVLPALLERARTAERRRLYRQGLAGFDRLARRRSGRRFVELPA